MTHFEENGAFVPRSTKTEALTFGFPEESLRYLIQNSMLHADGSVNTQTERRLGCDKRPD